MGTTRHARERGRRTAIAFDDREFLKLAAAWVAKTDVLKVDTGLSPEEALRLAPEFLCLLSEGKLSASNACLDNNGIDVLHAACRLLAEPNAGCIEEPLRAALGLYNFIKEVTWPGTDLGERAELLESCAFAGWRIADQNALPFDVEQWSRRLFSAADHASGLVAAIRKSLLSVVTELPTWIDPDWLDDAQALILVLHSLQSLVDAEPGKVAIAAEHLYNTLIESETLANWPTEREYLRGEAARLAGGAARSLGRRQRAVHWLNVAQQHFRHSRNIEANLARVFYHRLALYIEARDLADERLQQSRDLASYFEAKGMRVDGLKARFLEGIILKETDRLADASKVFEVLVEQTKVVGDDNLVGIAYVDLIQTYALLGEEERAIAAAADSLDVLAKLGNRRLLAKLEWARAFLLVSQGKPLEAITAYRKALRELTPSGAQTDIVDLHLAIAELLLEVGSRVEATKEIQKALRIIDESELFPEALVAITLLKMSLRRGRLEPQTLRDLRSRIKEDFKT